VNAIALDEEASDQHDRLMVGGGLLPTLSVVYSGLNIFLLCIQTSVLNVYRQVNMCVEYRLCFLPADRRSQQCELIR